MHLFGRSGNKELKGSDSIRGNKKNERKLKKEREKAYRISFKNPSDVRLFRTMPYIFVVACMLSIVSLATVHHNTAVYKQKVLESSMKQGTNLPLWGGTSTGQLSLQHTLLSKDGKTLAVEIQYDSNAHTQLSSFGNKYKLRLVTTKSNPMRGTTIKYGLFGTDGSGVLIIHNPNGFKDEAFVVMIIDNGHLVTADQLNGTNDFGGQSDDSLDTSITAQLSNSGNVQNNSQSTSNSQAKQQLPPLYYIRLNAQTTKKSNENWHSNKQLIDDLFINDNIRSIENGVKKSQRKINSAQDTLDEMNERLKENPNDSIAFSNKQNIEQSLQQLKQQVQQAQANATTIKNSDISDNILDPMQTKFRTYQINNLTQFSSSGQ